MDKVKFPKAKGSELFKIDACKLSFEKYQNGIKTIKIATGIYQL
jgi:hypothetical protein